MKSLLWCFTLLAFPALAAPLDLSRAVVVAPGLTGPPRKAVDMLVAEVAKRAQVRWTVSSQAGGPVSITVRQTGGEAPEGYRLRTNGSGIEIMGNDSRGVLFGIGRLLRSLRMERGAVTLEAPLDITTAPKTRLRGHQLGYRPKTNSYDAWTLPMWEQYIRDLAVFGTNAIELIPPRSDDAPDSPHFPLPQVDMMAGMSQVLKEYGLDCWIWYPALDSDYSNPATVDAAIKEWTAVFQRLPKIDAILVPGGDPGHTPPRQMFNLLAKQTESLHRFHPNAQMWLSPQGFSQQWFDEFLNILRNEQPAWLTGVVYAPWTRVTIDKFRQLVPAKYPIRAYPDITHTLTSQFPVPDWDVAYMLTLGREPINPRPLDEAHIFHVLRPHTIGSITYSEGCNDDVNKVVWSALGWDPDASVVSVLREYSRYFLGPRYEDNFAQGLLALERNWRGPLLTNGAVENTLQQFQAMERSATPQDRLNWRFQQALYRAYYDAYTRRRLTFESGLEQRAEDRLRQARELGALTAVQQAEAILQQAITDRPAQDWRARVFELAEALYQSIRMQLSVPRYQAIGVGRGANLDTIDAPLNNVRWFQQQFAAVRKLSEERERLEAIDKMLHWCDPGPGGFYDDLGNASEQPHVIREPGFAKDPSFVVSPTAGLIRNPNGRLSSSTILQTVYETPLRMHYTGLDPHAGYRLRVIYVGDAEVPVRLVANDSIEIHGLLPKKGEVLEFDVPRAATTSGELNLSWNGPPGVGGSGRGGQVAEVWLMRQRLP